MSEAPKHIFLTPCYSPFTGNLLKNLAYLNAIKPDEWLVVIYSVSLLTNYDNERVKNDFKNTEFSVVEYKSFIDSHTKALSLTSLSLVPESASIVREILAVKNVGWERFTIILTDDEIDRWNQSFKKHDKIQPCDRLYINGELIDVPLWQDSCH